MGWNSRLRHDFFRPGKGRRAFLRRKKAEIRRQAGNLQMAVEMIEGFKASLDRAEDARSSKAEAAKIPAQVLREMGGDYLPTNEVVARLDRISRLPIDTRIWELNDFLFSGRLNNEGKERVRAEIKRHEAEWAKFKAELDADLADELFDDY